jgi:alkaline phosphatase D
MTWDDHEVQNDYAGLQAGDGQVGVPDFAARRAAAYQAYYENMPLRASVLTQALGGLAQGAEMRLYGQLSFGKLAHLYLLDARQYKDPQVCNPEGKTGSSLVRPETCAPWNDPNRSLLGMPQEKWLASALASADAAGAKWNVLGQQSLLGPRDFAIGPAQKFWNDGWDGYNAARTRLTRALQQPGVANPVVLGGDVHENWVGHVLADYARPESAKVGVEFCGTSITSRSGKVDSSAALLQENPHFVFANAQYRGYGVAEFTPGALQVRLRALDDVARPDSGVQTLASFAVEAGRSEVLAA